MLIDYANVEQKL